MSRKFVADEELEVKYKEFCEYFEELEDEGICYGLGDTIRKARELGLPLPNDVLKHLRSFKNG